jgi:hypothetical protein
VINPRRISGADHLVAGNLGYFANGGIATAVLIGGIAAGGALAVFHTLLAPW